MVVSEATPGAAETQAAVEVLGEMKVRGMRGMRENLLEANLLSACWGSFVYVCMHAHECACPLCVVFNAYVLHTHASMHACVHTYRHACMHTCLPTVI